MAKPTYASAFGPRPPGIKQLKRTFTRTRQCLFDLNRVLNDLQEAQAYLPPGILAPAIDLMFDKVEQAQGPYETACTACLARGIRSVQGYSIPRDEFIVDDLNSDEIDSDEI